jgi:hypothetical protein
LEKRTSSEALLRADRSGNSTIKGHAFRSS